MNSAQGAGRLFYLMGASGVGKDSLMHYARQRLEGEVHFAHRYITRPPEAGGENHVWLSEREFERREEAGFFALSWRSHGWRYGVGSEIDAWLAGGFGVVVNGSRAYLPEAQRRYPALVPVLVDAAPEALAARLASRGREDAAAIAARLKRSATLSVDAGDDWIVLRNDGPLAEAGEALVRLLAGEPAACA